MNSLFSATESSERKAPVSLFDYKDMLTPLPADEEKVAEDVQEPLEKKNDALPGLAPQEVEALVVQARLEARAAAREEVEKRLRAEYDSKLTAEKNRITQTIQLFINERANYYSRVESEIIMLSLSIAKKILHRESQLDPMLLAALVRVAIEKLQDGSKVTVRVGKGKDKSWRTALSSFGNGAEVTVAEDSSLTENDCILETNVGIVNFNIDSQLKEIEQGFFDLLAQRPS